MRRFDDWVTDRSVRRHGVERFLELAARGQREPQRLLFAPGELDAFADLVESREMRCDWSIIFVAALDGRDDRPPTSEEAQAPLLRMVDAIKAGSLGAFIPFDRTGAPVLFQ